jgi:hypothetical protein
MLQRTFLALQEPHAREERFLPLLLEIGRRCTCGRAFGSGDELGHSDRAEGETALSNNWER